MAQKRGVALSKTFKMHVQICLIFDTIPAARAAQLIEFLIAITIMDATIT